MKKEIIYMNKAEILELPIGHYFQVECMHVKTKKKSISVCVLKEKQINPTIPSKIKWKNELLNLLFEQVVEDIDIEGTFWPTGGSGNVIARFVRY